MRWIIIIRYMQQVFFLHLSFMHAVSLPTCRTTYKRQVSRWAAYYQSKACTVPYSQFFLVVLVYVG